MHKLRRLMGAVDRLTYQVERWALLVSVFMMTVLVFLDVVQRTFSRPIGKTAKFIEFFLGLFGELSAATTQSIQTFWGPTLFWGFATLFIVSGAQTSRTIYAKRRAEKRGEPTQEIKVALMPGVVLGCLITAGLYGGIKLLIVLAPSGISGAQKFALGFLVWSGFLGASLATRSSRHIVLDAVKKKLDTRTRIWYSALGGLLVFIFCGLIFYLGAHKTITEIIEWHESNGVIHVYEALPIPVWVVSIAIPLFFGLIGVRSLVFGFEELLYGPSLMESEDMHGIDFQALAQDGSDSEEARLEKERRDAERKRANIFGQPSSDSPMLTGEWQ